MWKIKRQLAKTTTRDRYLQFAANSPSSSLMSSGGQCIVKVNRGSAGLIKRQYIVIDFTIGTAQVKLTAVPFWISLLQNYMDTSSNPTQQIYDVCHLVHLNTLTREKFRQEAEGLLVKENGFDTPYLQTGSYRAYIRVIGSLYENLYLRGIENDMNVEINFNSTSCVDTLGTGTVTVNNVYVFLKEHEMSQNLENELKAKYKSGVMVKNFISYNRYTNSSTVTTAAVNSFQLNSIRNYNGFLFFILRASTSPTSHALAKFLKLGDNVSIGSYQLTDGGGRSITGLNLDSFGALRVYDTPDYFEGDLAKKYPFYTIAHAHPEDAINGIPSGYYKYTGTEILQITPGATTAETARVVTLQPLLASTLAGTAATAGNCQIQYIRGDGAVYTSATILYSANQAAVNAAVLAMGIPDISVAAGANGFNSTAGVALTITNLQEIDLAVNFAQWSIVGNSLTNGALPLLVTNVDTTAGITLKGFTTQTAQLDVYGGIFRVLRIDGGYCSVRDYEPGM